jgi:hypothetical protein
LKGSCIYKILECDSDGGIPIEIPVGYVYYMSERKFLWHALKGHPRHGISPNKEDAVQTLIYELTERENAA